MKNSSTIYALNIRERTALHQKSKLDVANECADKSLWWQKQYFRGSDTDFKNYLRQIGGNHKLLDCLPAPAIKSSLLREFHKAFKPFKQTHSKSSWRPQNTDFIGHEWLCSLLMGRALAQFSQALQAINASKIRIDREAILSGFYETLNLKLYSVLMPTLALEANLSRLLNEESASTPEERFADFAIGLNAPERQESFWNKYPVLWRRCATISMRYTESSIETIERIFADFEAIRAHFNFNDGCTLRSINWGKGDTHCHGRSVAILKIGHKQLVYKPKSLKIDVAYNKFIEWYSSRTSGLKLKTYKVLDCGAHGYCEFVSAQKCRNETELKRYYRRAGSMTALFWLLGGSDMHHENLIAVRGFPVPIDLETLLDRPINTPQKGTYQSLFMSAFEGFLLKTYILPFRERAFDGVKDISALGARGEQTASVEARHLANAARDDIRIELKPGTIQQENNTPGKEETTCNLVDYLDDIIRGYTDAVDTIQKFKGDLLGSKGVLRSFKKAKARWIGRKTQEYGTLLQNMSHPTMLKDAVEADALIGTLWKPNTLNSQLNKLIASEYQDIWNDDIPYFWTTSESRDLFDSRGLRIKNFFISNGLEEIEKRLDALSVYKKAHIVSIETAIISTIPIVEAPQYSQKLQASVYRLGDDQTPLAMACDIGDFLLERAVMVDGVPFWTALTQLDEKHYTTSILPPNLYDGTPGIGIFYAHLYSCTKNKRYRKVAEGAHKLIRYMLDAPKQFSTCGAFNGLSGLIYADIVISTALNLKLITNGHVLDHLLSLIKKDTSNDIIFGAAGALIVALRFYKVTRDPTALDLAKEAAIRLDENKETKTNGYAWGTSIAGATPFLGGLAHGTAGIAWALSELYSVSKNIRWKNLAQEAFAYEQSLYNPKKRTWRDLRSNETYTSAWCHGAAGIGLVSTRLACVMPSREYQEAINIAQSFTLRHKMESDCICHGSLGNMELFAPTKTADNKMFDQWVARKQREGITCGIPGHLPTPSLMCGYAGIGYALLRQAFPDKVPNILLLDA